MFRLIRRVIKWGLLASLVVSLAHSTVVDPAGAVPALCVLVVLGYVFWRAWPSIRADLDRVGSWAPIRRLPSTAVVGRRRKSRADVGTF